MRNKTYQLCIMFFLITQFGYTQLSDLMRLEYSFIPKRKSENKYNRFRGLLNYPIKVGEDKYLIIGAEYNRIILELEDDYSFESDGLQRIHVIDATLGYTFKASENWRLAARITPRIASTLTSKITGEDFFINGGVYAILDKRKVTNTKRPYRLIFGLVYNSTTGLPFPLPMLNYYRKVNENWSYTLGIPKSNLKYYFNDKNIMQTFITLDGYYAHVQKEITVNNQTAEHISLRVIVGGLGYEHNFTKHLVGYIYTGYTLSQKSILRDKDSEKVFTLDDVNTVYLRTGIKYKI